MEVLQPNSNIYHQILESSSNFWPPLLTTIDAFLSPQNFNISITNPSNFPPLIHHQNDVVGFIQQRLMSENLNSNLGVVQLQLPLQATSNEIIRPKEKEIWYKGPWTKCEDRQLRRLVSRFGVRWETISQYMSRRIGKQCRERWHNHLRPPLEKNIVWSDEEEMIIIEGQKRFGNSWSKIARFLPGRSENDIKNHWNKTLRRQFSSKNIQRPKRLRGLYKSTVLEDYIREKLFPFSAADAPPPITIVESNPLTEIASTAAEIGESNPLFEVISTATASAQPQIHAASEENALIGAFSTFAAATAEIGNSALICTISTPPPIAAVNHDYNALAAADPPLSVDDYDIDGVPCFAFETAMQSVDPSPIIGDDDCAATAAYFAAETVGEEMDFMRNLFGNNGGI